MVWLLNLELRQLRNTCDKDKSEVASPEREGFHGRCAGQEDVESCDVGCL